MEINLDRNVQAIVPHEVHKTLRDMAYEKGVGLKDLIRAVLIEVTEKHKSNTQG